MGDRTKPQDEKDLEKLAKKLLSTPPKPREESKSKKQLSKKPSPKKQKRA